MSPPQRRRSDGVRPAADAPSVPGSGTLDVDDWLRRCMDRMLEVDPTLSRQEAEEVARTMLTFERTSLMAPEAAVDFVVAELIKPATRFERRTAPRGTRH